MTEDEDYEYDDGYEGPEEDWEPPVPTASELIARNVQEALWRLERALQDSFEKHLFEACKERRPVGSFELEAVTHLPSEKVFFLDGTSETFVTGAPFIEAVLTLNDDDARWADLTQNLFGYPVRLPEFHLPGQWLVTSAQITCGPGGYMQGEITLRSIR